MTGNYDLDRAYTIDGPEEARRLYAEWADTYDDAFRGGWGYVAAREIAGIMKELQDGDTPILDIGAGTGALAEHLDGLEADAFDITPEMLEIARGKGLYRNCIEGDLTRTLDLPDNAYGSVISCGTFTHGHVGPGCFPELLRVTRPGALFVCGTIPAVFDDAGFGSALALMVARGQIEPVRFRQIDIYEGADHAHAGDKGLVMVFRTAA